MGRQRSSTGRESPWSDGSKVVWGINQCGRDMERGVRDEAALQIGTGDVVIRLAEAIEEF